MGESRTIFELPSDIREVAECAFKKAHSGILDFSSPSDRAWIEGFSHASLSSGELSSRYLVSGWEWKPINSAPKDGTPMFVHSRNGWIGRVQFNEAEGCFMDEHTEFVEARWLTHWMPLPPPPTADR